MAVAVAVAVARARRVSEISPAAFTARSALAFAQKQGDTSLIASVEPYADAGVTCANRIKHPHSTMVHLGDIGGTSDALHLTGTPQPASMSFRIGDEVHYALDDSSTWMQLDKLSYAAGDRLSGRAVVATSPQVKPEDAASLGGTFDAIVCAE